MKAEGPKRVDTSSVALMAQTSWQMWPKPKTGQLHAAKMP
jgi:hypothetical protein